MHLLDPAAVTQTCSVNPMFLASPHFDYSALHLGDGFDAAGSPALALLLFQASCVVMALLVVESVILLLISAYLNRTGSGTLACLALVALIPNVIRAQEVPLDTKLTTLKFTGHAFLHNFNGEALQFTGSANVDPKKPVLVTSAKIEIAAAKMTTFEPARDKNMYAWLHVDTVPKIAFEVTRVLSMDGRAATATKDHPANFLVSGQLTLNKIPKSLATQASAWRDGKYLVVTGSTQVDTTTHGLPIIKQFFMTVDKEVDVDFNLVFDLPPSLQVAAPLPAP